MQNTIEQIEAGKRQAAFANSDEIFGKNCLERRLYRTAFQRGVDWALEQLTSQAVQEDKTAEDILWKYDNERLNYPNAVFKVETIVQAMHEYATIREQKAVEVALQLAADKGKAHSESRFESVHYCECIPCITKDSILSLTPEALTLLKDR